MTKLKTLKDLELCCTIHSVPEEDWACSYVHKKIKVEAIKWVKAMDAVKIKGSVDWKEVFKNFHEIGEDDLK